MIDLHIHSTYSDGSNSPTEILRIAQEQKLEYISITDHNSVDAYNELRKTRNLFEGKIISGVEISTSYKGQNIEILGYGIDIKSIEVFLNKHFKKNENQQSIIFNTLYNAYKKIGVRMDITEYDPTIDKFSRPILCKDIISHPENAKFF